ncbi:MAG: hypothetical protein WD317_11325 [Balneolaceae bacterium]
MDIFKLIYEHDLRMDDLRGRHTDRDSQDLTQSIEEFMRPDPTYSRFYLSGSRLDLNHFGLDTLDGYPAVLDKLRQALSGYRFFTEKGESTDIGEALKETDIWQAILLTRESQPKSSLDSLHIDSGSNVGHRKTPLRETLMRDELVLYKEKAHQGFDLHLFSKENIYRDFFFPLKELVSDRFRFFSINGKRVRTERKFYFETWTLQRPPHGVEEVFDETVL